MQVLSIRKINKAQVQVLCLHKSYIKTVRRTEKKSHSFLETINYSKYTVSIMVSYKVHYKWYATQRMYNIIINTTL